MRTDKHNCSCKSNKADHEDVSSNNSNAKKRVSRSAGIIKSIIPVIALTLIPKCPVCLAAYVALATGIGLSITTAAFIRTTLIILCVLSITYFIMKQVRRFIEQ